MVFIIYVVIQSIDISPASVHYIDFLEDIKSHLSDCALLGEKGYLSQTIQIKLFNAVNLRLETLKRLKHKITKLILYIQKYRQRIEIDCV